jgi:hypothetical protein
MGFQNSDFGGLRREISDLGFQMSDLGGLTAAPEI